MANSFYWFKVYNEILDDPKMGKLSDRLYRRAIEMMAFASRNNDNGKLPPVDDMTWILHTTEDDLNAELKELASDKYNILTIDTDGCYVVKNFQKRQERISVTERQQYKRKRDINNEYTGNDSVTIRDNIVTKPVTTRETELDIELDIDIELDKKFDNLMTSIQTLTGTLQTHLDYDAIKEMAELGIIDDDIRGAVAYLTAKGYKIRGARSLINAVKVEREKRIQKSTASQYQQDEPVDMKGYTDATIYA
jgi:hypothetical protein